MTAKSSTERVAKLRRERAELGQTRLELYSHPSDHTAIKALARQLEAKRRALDTQNSGDRTCL